MKTWNRIAMTLSVWALALGVSTVVVGKGKPAPPPPVLCGCLCPDGSIVVTHAPDANSCPTVCETACNQTM